MSSRQIDKIRTRFYNIIMKYIEKIIEISNKKRAPLKTSEILELGVEYSDILLMEKEGALIRVKSGYYQPKDVDFDEEEIIGGLFPDGILTLDTALFYHGYIKKRPKTWQIAISKNVSKSRFKLKFPDVKPSYMEKSVLEDGLTHIDTKHGALRIYSIDRLICDVLKYEEKLEFNVVQSALKHYISDPNKDISRLLEYSRLRKVQNKIKALVLPWLKDLDEKAEDTPKAVKEIVLEEKKEISLLSNEELSEAIYLFISKSKESNLSNGQESIYYTISNNVIDGKSLWRLIKEKYKEDKDFEEKIRNINSKRQFNMSFDDKKVENAFWSFLNPIFVALERDEIFFGDWMPELERYL